MRTHRRIQLLSLPLVAAVVLALGGCGGSSTKTSTTARAPQSTTPSTAAATSPKTAPAGGAAQVVKLSADPSGALKFTTTTLQAKAGRVTLDMSNPSPVPHSIAVKGNGVNALSPQATVGQGQSARVTTTLKPGTYTFYCPVPGHEAAGMRGTVTVR
jgi:plastocyanin